MAIKFNSKHFTWLVIRYWQENWKMHITILGIVTLMLMFLSYLVDRGTADLGLFPFALCLAGCFITSRAFNDWSDFGRSSGFLMIPASVFEKFLSVIVNTTLILIPVFTFWYFLMTYLFMNLFYPHFSLLKAVSGWMNGYPDYAHIYLATLLVYFIVQPFFLLISVRFRKQQFLIAILLVVAIFFLYFYWQSFILNFLSKTFVISEVYFNFNANIRVIDLIPLKYKVSFVILNPWLLTANQLIWAVIGLGLYATVYFSLKEREI